MFSEFFRLLRTSIILICISRFTNAAWLRCYNGSLDEYLVTPLNKQLPETFMSCINVDLPTVIYTFGYRGRVNGPATTAVMRAYIATKKRNVILLDWEEEAKSGLLGIPLGYALNAVPNARKIGKELGDFLIGLAETGTNITDIHLVGHSLGAHIMGFAGRQAREKGHVLSRITGLDPARALFEGTFAFQSGLDRTCAKFVEIIHSDPGGYGTSTPSGTVDIWPNYSSTGSKQPGCDDGNFDMFTTEDLCDHDRSWRYYVESIAWPTAFPAVAAKDYDSWLANKHNESAQTIYLGDLTSTRAKGNYYLTTNSKPPYSKGVEGIKPDRTQ